MNKLSTEKRAAIISALVEGNSLRSTARMTGHTLNTVMRLLVDAGKACAAYQDEHLRNLPCKRIQVDEIWSYIGIKEKNRPEAERGEFGRGDCWVWTAIDAQSKLVPCWLVGTRDALAAREFLFDLSVRINGRFQLTSDGHSVYRDAVERVFGREIDFAMLIKEYGSSPDAETRYSPAECIGAHSMVVVGDPKAEHISTSFAERANLTMRMSMRRFTRLTNGFSKKVENHAAAIALHFMAYNFAKVHGSLRISPAQAAGVDDHLWSIEEIAALVP
jgi:IS1 family transposase